MEELYLIKFPTRDYSYVKEDYNVCIDGNTYSYKELSSILTSYGNTIESTGGLKKRSPAKGEIVKQIIKVSIVIDPSIEKIEIRRIFPTELLMPDYFLIKLLDDRKFLSDDLNLGNSSYLNDTKIAMDNLVSYNWNPELSLEKPLVSVIFGLYRNTVQRMVILPRFIINDWNRYKNSYNLPDEIVDKNHFTYDLFHRWKDDFQRKDPAFSFEHWKNSKETNPSWISIK